jgi:5-methylcytosine-specific restriction endonuclease McrA
VSNKVKKYNKITWAKAKLRNASIQWPPGNEAIKRSRIERGVYQCADCKQPFKRNQIHKDHKNPVVDVEKGFTTLDEWVDRLLVDVEGYQILCEQCHNNKSSLENEMRKYYKKKQKKKKK